MNMFQDDAAELLVKKGADKDYRGRVIVPEHIPKVRACRLFHPPTH